MEFSPSSLISHFFISNLFSLSYPCVPVLPLTYQQVLYYHTLPPFFHPLSFPLYSTPMHFLFVWCRYHIQYTDGEEEDLTQDEIIPLLPARDCSERIPKHHKASWVRDAYGKLLSWADHPDGGSWVDTCCCPECEGGWYCFCYSIFCCLLQYLMFYVCFLLVLQ